MDDDVICVRCDTPVDVWSLGRSFAFWFAGGGVMIFLGALTLPVGIGFVILPVGVVMALSSPLAMFTTKGMRRCPSCRKMWRQGQDDHRAYSRK